MWVALLASAVRVQWAAQPGTEFSGPPARSVGTFVLSSATIWARPVVAALRVAQR
jgi:hypothetical protein